MLFSLLQHIARPIKRPSCEFHYHRVHAVKFRNVLLQTWKPPKNPFWCFFWARNEHFCHIIAFFIVATPCGANWTAFWWVSASSNPHKKIRKRFSADIRTQNKTIFWQSWVRKEIFFSQNSVFYFHCTFYFPFHGCSVKLSIIGIIQWKFHDFWCRPENRKNPPSF